MTIECHGGRGCIGMYTLTLASGQGSGARASGLSLFAELPEPAFPG